MAGQAEWSCLEDAFVWPTQLKPLSVVTAEAVAAQGHPILDPASGDRPAEPLGSRCTPRCSGPIWRPRLRHLAIWVESLASSLHSLGDAGNGHVGELL